MGSTTIQHVRVSWFELFYDLAIVATLVAINDAFLEDPTPIAALTAAIAAAALFTVWLLTTLAITPTGGNNPAQRLLMLVQMGALIWLVIAIGEHAAVPTRTGLIAFGVALVTTAALWWRADQPHRTSYLPALAGIGAIASVPLPESWTWAVLAITTLMAAIPAIAEWVRKDDTHPSDPDHIAERMGLFILIVLGLSFGQLVVDLGQAEVMTDMRFFVLMFVVMFAVWWMYFGLKVPEGPMVSGRHRRAWITAHYLLLIGVAGVGDILSALTSYPDSELVLDGAAYLGLSTALILVGIAIVVPSAQGLRQRQALPLFALALIALGVGIAIDVLETTDLRVATLGGVGLLIASAALLAFITRHRSAESRTRRVTPR